MDPTATPDTSFNIFEDLLEYYGCAGIAAMNLVAEIEAGKSGEKTWYTRPVGLRGAPRPPIGVEHGAKSETDHSADPNQSGAGGGELPPDA